MSTTASWTTFTCCKLVPLMLYTLLKKKWIEDFVGVDKDLKTMVTNFFGYFTQVSFFFVKWYIDTVLLQGLGRV